MQDDGLVMGHWVPGNSASLWLMTESNRGVYTFKNARYSKFIQSVDGSLDLTYDIEGDVNFHVEYHNDEAPKINAEEVWIENISGNRLIFNNGYTDDPVTMEIPTVENSDAFVYSFKYLGALQYALYNETTDSYVVVADSDLDEDGFLNDITNKSGDLPINLGWVPK